MLPDLGEIPRLRRALGLSQRELASRAGISQSAVAKIERGRANPSYAAARRLLEVLESERHRREPSALVAEVRSPRVIAVTSALELEAAVAQMRKHGFSQLPVIDGRHAVGSLTERGLTGQILSGKTPADFARLRVADVMDPPFPTIDDKAPVHLAAALLQHYPAVLTTLRGQVHGIVTKSDLLKLV